MTSPAEFSFDGSSILYADTWRLGVYAVITVKTLGKKNNLKRQHGCKNKSAQMLSWTAPDSSGGTDYIDFAHNGTSATQLNLDT